MTKIDIIRAWKDAEYRASLSPDQLAELPENPAGMVALSDDELLAVSGGVAAAGTGTGTGSGAGCSCNCHCVNPL